MADVTLAPRVLPPGVDAFAVSSGDLLLPLSGAWTAHLALADEVDPPAGLVALDWQGTTMLGHVVRSGAHDTQVYALVEGGNGGLNTVLPAQEFQSIQVQPVLEQILSNAGERLSPTSTPSVLAHPLARWLRRQDRVAALLDDLARAAGAGWRVLADGSVWFGKETWAEAAEADWDETHDSDPSYRFADFTPLELGPQPGQSYQKRRIGAVHHELGPDSFSARLYFTDGSGALDTDPIRQALATFVREVVPLSYLKRYPGRVAVQRPDGTVDVQLDTKAVPPLRSVRYRTGAGPVRLALQPGQRVLVGFEDGNDALPIVEVYEPGDAQRDVSGVGDTVSIGTLTITAVAMGAITGTYTPPGGAPEPFSLNTPITLRGRITSGWSGMKLP